MLIQQGNAGERGLPVSELSQEAVETVVFPDKDLVQDETCNLGGDIAVGHPMPGFRNHIHYGLRLAIPDAAGGGDLDIDRAGSSPFLHRSLHLSRARCQAAGPHADKYLAHSSTLPAARHFSISSSSIFLSRRPKNLPLTIIAGAIEQHPRQATVSREKSPSFEVWPTSIPRS